MLLGAAVYGPRGWAAYQEWNLARLPLPQLEARVRGRPGDTSARYRLGLSYARENRTVEATRELLAVLQQEPTRADVLNDLGVCYLLQQRYYESLVALRGAVTADPRLASAWANLGRLHIATKMPFSAVSELEKALALEPDNVATLLDLGEACQYTLNYQAALRAFERAVRLRPREAAAHLGLGKTYFALTRYEDAERSLATAISLDPRHAPSLLTLGRLRLERASSPGDVEAAGRLIRQATELEPSDPEGWYDLGRVQLRQNQSREAVVSFERTLRLSEQHPGALHLLARALRGAGRPGAADRAEQLFRRRSLQAREESRLEERVHQSPRDWDSRALLASLYLKSQKRGLAMLVCRELEQGAPTHPRLPGLLRQLAARNEAASGGRTE